MSVTLVYEHAFGERAAILIGKRRDEVTASAAIALACSVRAAVGALLGDADWQRLQETLADADFWSLPAVVPSGSLDGYEVIVQGRRGDEFRATRIGNPRVRVCGCWAASPSISAAWPMCGYSRATLRGPNDTRR